MGRLPKILISFFVAMLPGAALAEIFGVGGETGGLFIIATYFLTYFMLGEFSKPESKDSKKALFVLGGLAIAVMVVAFLLSDSTDPAPAKTPTVSIGYRSRCPYGCTVPVLSCHIKGIVTRNGNFYLMPGHSSYGEFQVLPEYGDRWFCREDEAIRSGWRKAQN